MTAVLLACAAATLFMTGLTWFVQVVHYPLFPAVGEDQFPDFHRIHSNRTTWVVLPPMLVELLTSWALLFDPPADSTALVAAGAALATGTWLLTAFGAAPAHGEIGRQGLSPALTRRLSAFSWARTVCWSAHAVVVLALLATAIDGGS
mgnify:FL=1